MKRLWLLCLVVIPWLPTLVSAQPVPQFYDRATLVQWQTRYQQSMARLFQVGLQPFLTAEANRELAAVKLEIPLTTPGTSDPFLFYSDPTAATVTMPALSLKFLDDFSVAYAWLSVNGCSLETPAEYISMLKYHQPTQFASGRYPPPLEALHIPEEALADPAVDELALALFNHARAFILAHELAHIYYDHPGYGPGTARAARRHEAAADQFALDILRQSGTIPVGVLTFFLAWAHYAPNRWDFAEEADWQAYLDQATHPLTSARLAALAATLEANVERFARAQPDPASARETIQFLASNIAGIARRLDDPEVQAAITLAAAETTVEDLAPRCPQAPATAPLPARPAFDGRYRGEFIYRTGEGQETLPVEVTLQRSDDQVTGRFNFGLGAGSLSGPVVENTLYFTWAWGWMVGQGVFYAMEEGEAFAGSWGFDQSQDNGGGWRGQRAGVEEGEAAPTGAAPAQRQASIPSLPSGYTDGAGAGRRC